MTTEDQVTDPVEEPTTEEPTTEGTSETPATFDEWIQAQPEDVQHLVTGHTAGLRSALDSERSERKALARQLRELTAKAEEGSELRGQLEKLNADYEITARKAAFYEGAPGNVTNVRLAYLAAQDLGILEKDGSVDWSELQSAAPELFRRQQTPPAHAGNGTGQPPATRATMNDFIRAAAGRP